MLSAYLHSRPNLKLDLCRVLNPLADSELGHEHPQASIITAWHVSHGNTLAVKFGLHPQWSMCYDAVDIKH